MYKYDMSIKERDNNNNGNGKGKRRKILEYLTKKKKHPQSRLLPKREEASS